MKVFTCVDHDGHWPVGVASVIIAEDASGAKELLSIELARRGLESEDFTLTEVSLCKEQAIVLQDGEY